MNRNWFAPIVVGVLAGVAMVNDVQTTRAEEPRVGKSAATPPASPPAVASNEQATYVVEIRIIESTPAAVNPGVSEDAQASPLGVQNDVVPSPRPAQTTNLLNCASCHASYRQPSSASNRGPVEATSEAEIIWNLTNHGFHPGTRLLAAPKIAVLAGQSASVQVGTVQTFTYLEPMGERRFVAKTSPTHELGIQMSLTARPVELDEQSVELSPIEIKITALDGREPVEGLDFEVGKPIVSTRSLSTTAKMKLGAVRLIGIPTGPRQEAVLLVRVKNQPPGE